MSFFSIVIPTYNRAQIISNTINSVLCQKFEDWELIIVDDGGQDETEEVVQKFEDSRIKYFWIENGERGAARNYGTKKSVGKYIFFLDSDDLIYENHLSHAKKMIDKLDKPAFFHSRYEEVYPDRRAKVEILNKKKIWSIIQKQNKFACQFFLRKDIALNFPFSVDRNLKIGEDWLVILKVGLKYHLNVSNQITAALVQHDSRSMKIINPDDAIYSRDLIICELKKEAKVKETKIIKNVYYELSSLAALSASINKNRLKALKLISNLFFINPFRVMSEKRTLAIIKHLLI